ncbi:putative actinorhodin transporter [Streptomyces afghaniensis 772]|uniref:Putative actinorhodin transporter n=1 Tax=Streptomyces afghaniensis 772 TaxID=1283301 RepID=S4MJF7_9ACTN|nr:MFS transporter [Streptomyces afghaniensis]EPJ36716.1 putative actinorhodin transporter [Streptomyces afghaniensis 772]
MSTTEMPQAVALPDGPAFSARRAWAAVGIILVGEVMDLLDSLVTTIAGPTITRDMGGSQEFIQWLAAGYTIAMAAGLLIGGRLGDKYGRKNLFLTGLAGFTVTSLVSALATNPETLITARVLQGLLGALMVPQALGIIRSLFPPDKVGMAFGVTGPVMALSGVAGPIVAGWLVDADYFGWSWRMIFAVNVPVGVLALVAGLVLLPRSQRQRDLRIDLVGAVIAAAGMAAVIFPLVQGRELGWPWWVFLLLAAGIGTLAGFVRHQYHRADKGLPTLVLPSLFRKKAFVSGLFIGILFFSVMMGGALLFGLFFQLGLGMSPLKAGLATIAQAAGMVLGFGFSQALGMARRTMFIGFAATAVGLLAALGTIAVQDDPVNAWWLSPALAVLGVGSGLAIAPFFDIVLSGVDERETGSASGTLTSAQQVGNALGASVLGTVFFSVLNGRRGEGASAFTAATSAALLVALALVAGAALCTRWLPERAVRPAEE